LKSIEFFKYCSHSFWKMHYNFLLLSSVSFFLVFAQEVKPSCHSFESCKNCVAYGCAWNMNRVQCLQSSDEPISAAHIQDVTDCFSESKRRNLDTTSTAAQRVYVNFKNTKPGYYTCESVYCTDECFTQDTCEEESKCPDYNGQPVSDSSSTTPVCTSSSEADSSEGSSTGTYSPTYYPTEGSSSGDDDDNEEIEIILVASLVGAVFLLFGISVWLYYISEQHPKRKESASVSMEPYGGSRSPHH